jgi:2-keto-4-pentenoate hydratase
MNASGGGILVDAIRIDELAAALAGAYADAGRTVAAAPFAALSLEEALAVQGKVLAALGETVPVAKVAVNDGTAVAAPIYGALSVASGGRLGAPARGLVGIEVEIAARLKADVGPGADAAAAIEGLVCGIEVIGTRFDDRKAAGAFGPLADNLLTAGYAYGIDPWTGGTDVDGIDIVVEIDGRQVYSGKAKHPFGGVLQPILAQARAPHDGFGGLKAGMIVTTGTLCGVVPVPGPCMITARLAGTHEVRLQLM